MIVLPEVISTEVADGLCQLTEELHQLGHMISGGVLGGTYGYGSDFENDVFMMHPFCWCERSDCPWCVACSCPPEAIRYVLNGEETDERSWYSAGRGADRHLETVSENQCANCRDEVEPAPNFRHKASGSTVRWYKYIGRDMKTELVIPWEDVLRDCLTSLP